MILPGLIASRPESGGYIASAVHFDGATLLNRVAGIACTDNGLFSVVGWAKLSHSDQQQAAALFTVGPEVNATPYFQFLAVGGATFPARLDLCNADFSSDGRVQTDTGTPPIPEDTWFCVMVSADVSADPAKFKIYLNDTNVTDVAESPFTNLPFTIASNGLPLWFGGDGFDNFISGDYADWRIMPGISLLNVGGDIPQATRRLFINASGKPVDPATATASLGAAGAVLFTGNASAFGTNAGTGGAFATTGTLTNAGTSPSD